MNSITNIQPSMATKENASIAGRAITSFGNEVDQLLAAVAQGSTSLSHLGQNVDVRA